MKPTRIDIESIGVDLDNTVIDYGFAYEEIAARLGVDVAVADRTHIRQSLRRSNRDDFEWREFQNLLYTEGLAFARPAEGITEFLGACAELGVSVRIISHKTERGPAEFGARDLRRPAVLWLREHGIIPELVGDDRLVFAETQDQKIALIAGFELDAFIDDLASVLTHAAWPEATMRIEYSPGSWRLVDGRWSAGFPDITAWLQE